LSACATLDVDASTVATTLIVRSRGAAATPTRAQVVRSSYRPEEPDARV